MFFFFVFFVLRVYFVGLLAWPLLVWTDVQGVGVEGEGEGAGFRGRNTPMCGPKRERRACAKEIHFLLREYREKQLEIMIELLLPRFHRLLVFFFLPSATKAEIIFPLPAHVPNGRLLFNGLFELIIDEREQSL